MNRRFRLHAVQRLRAAELDRAALALAQAQRAHAAAGEQLAALSHKIETCVPVPGPTGVTALALTSAAARRDALREQVAAVQAQLERAAQQVALATAGWQAARADLRVVQTLHERHRQSLVEENLRREQRLLDDLAGTARARSGFGGLGGDGGDAA